MNSKKATLGLLIAAAVSIPVFALSGPANNSKPIENSVYYNYNGPPAGMFANWTTKNKVGTLCFGTYEYTPAFIGMRVDAPAGCPANSFQMDINSYYGDQPFFKIYLVKPGTTAGQFFDNPVINASGITVTPRPNGFYRYYYNASSNNVPSGSKWSEIYLVDSCFSQDSIADTVTNVLVNGKAATVNFTTTPAFDCNLDY